MRYALTASQLIAIVKRFSRVRVAVIGDVILDEYIWGSVDRISPEAPVPVVWANKHTYVPGGSANVANNIRALGARVSLVGVVGEDKNKDILVAELKKRGVDTRGICVDRSRHTTVKTRIIAGHQQMLRVDWEHTEALTQELNQKILAHVRSIIADIDAVIIEDYGKGVINAHLIQELVRLARTSKKVVAVDPKEDHFQYYRGVTAITPNRKELENAVRNLKLKDTSNRFTYTNDSLTTPEAINDAARVIMEYLELDSLLVTLGEQGMKLFERGHDTVHIPTVAQEVFDVSGAGDTVIACFSLAMASAAGKKQAAYIANCAAGIVVSKLGTAVTSREELCAKIRELCTRYARD